ncbi:hypothetical protein NIES267_07280 [Calothrix parasitica NIES-267]|uniref:Leucine rich repeat variant n=1 Tax=Calothrix parasitica NIES-267 TaxID=1973488 RepID=A0A1Z4LJ46_9CYAN|nr:hypothetical protein NIES267_07280 [Calothrix parasitica NIES-267]
MNENNSIQQTIAALEQDINQARIVAAEPTTNPEILRELALFNDEKTREAVVSNANSPPETLVQLGEEFPSQFLDNPVFPLLILENPNFIQELPLTTLRSILKEENVPEYILEQAADKADVGVQLALANNIKTSKAILKRLNQSRDSEVVEAVNLHVNFVGELVGGVEEKVKELVPKSIPSRHRVNYSSLAVLAQICEIPEFIIEYWVEGLEYKYELLEKLADSPATPTLILKHLVNDSSTSIREKLAQNINTPIETLQKLAEERQGRQACIFLARNVSTPDDALKILSEDKDKWVRMSVVENSNTPSTLLKEMINDADKEVAQTAKQILGERQGDYTCEAIRKNPQTPPEALKKLAQKNPRCITYIAKHANISPEMLLKWSQSTDERLRRDVAENTSLPINILETLAKDDDSTVRRYIAQNPNTPINILFKNFARDTMVVSAIAYQMSNPKFRKYPEAEGILDILAEESTSPLESILQRLIKEGGEWAGKFLARRFDLPIEFLIQLAQADNFKVREAVAQNPRTPSSSLEKLAQALEPSVREAVAQNINTPTSALDKLAKDENSKTRMHTASKLNLSPDVLEELTKDKSAEVRDKAITNPSLAKDSIERILKSENGYRFLKLNPDYFSNRSDIRASVINHYANSKSPSMWVSYITLMQPEISQELLKNKSNSIFWVERLAVAKNPQASQNILENLRKDCNQLVRAAAQNPHR